MSDFDQWYQKVFGHLLESQEEEVKNSVRKIWASILVGVAEEFEFNDFENYTGQQIGKVLRTMAKESNGTDRS